MSIKEIIEEAKTTGTRASKPNDYVVAALKNGTSVVVRDRNGMSGLILENK